MTETSCEGYDRIVHIHDSSFIDTIAYKIKSKELLIKFSDTRSNWIYHNVWPSDFARLACAYSVGEAFNDVIKNRYEGTRLDSKTKTMPV